MSVTVRDLMTRDVLAVDPEMTLTQVERQLINHGVSGAPVVQGGVVIGVVSRADFVRGILADQVEAAKVSGFYSSPYPIAEPALEQLAIDSRRIVDHLAQTRVRDVMSTDLKSIAPDDDVQTVAGRMAEEGLHRLPVLEDGALVGILSSLDLVAAVGRLGLGPA